MRATHAGGAGAVRWSLGRGSGCRRSLLGCRLLDLFHLVPRGVLSCERRCIRRAGRALEGGVVVERGGPLIDSPHLPVAALDLLLGVAIGAGFDDKKLALGLDINPTLMGAGTLILILIAGGVIYSNSRRVPRDR